MPASPDCVLCLCRQSLEAARFASEDPVMHERVLHRAMQLAVEKGFELLPPILGTEIQREIRRITNNPDPYAEVKRLFDEMIVSKFEPLRKIIHDSPRPLETALRIAIAGNTIDFALGTHLNEAAVDHAISTALQQEITGNPEELFRRLASAKRVFYITDNSGEIACDRLFIEEILRQHSLELTVGVRGAAVLNDATREDAERVGLTSLVRVIDNGNDGLGTILDRCGEEFMSALHESDLLIAKGLANYETLIEYTPEEQPKPIAYLFKAKCAFIANYSGTRLWDIVVQVR